MRFVKTPKHSGGLVTTKGHYRNKHGRETHHSKKSETPINFVGVDGEGMTVDGEHRYVLFGVGDEQISNPDGLKWWEVFEFLYAKRKQGTAYIGFFLGYDFTQILKTLPEDRAWMLLTTEGKALRQHRVAGKAPHPVQADAPNGRAWQFDVLGMKRLRIRPKFCECIVATCKCEHEPWMYVCDAGSFFQTSFLKVIDPENWEGSGVVSQEEYDIIREGKEARSTAVLDEDMKQYNRMENEVLARVMHELDVGFHAIGIHLPPSKWFGPGQAAQQWLRNQKVATREDIEEAVPGWFLEAARMSYFGGWFEQFIHGIIPGVSHEYDINSAYPSIISNLPCLLHGVYERGRGLPPTSQGLFLVYANVWAPSLPTRRKRQLVGSMLHRDIHGRILRPMATEGWFWWDELQAAYRAGLVKRLDNKGHQQVYQWVGYRPCDCPPPMASIVDLYAKRLEVGKTSALGKAAKLVYNSDYGKFAQSVGEPVFGNPVYASRITSGCRTMVLDAIATHPKGLDSVAMVATDAVYFLSPHPGLSRSESLGEWDYKQRTHLTLFKPGVYWDEDTRSRIAEGKSAHFKARGFQAADFVNSIGRIDADYANWQSKFDAGDIQWPAVTFRPRFSMVTALQALRRHKWDDAGRVIADIELVQDSNPEAKRTGLFRDEYEGRVIWRSLPYEGIRWEAGNPVWTPSVPYRKRFGMDDPWSDEYREMMGTTPDGNVADILAWILTGE